MIVGMVRNCYTAPCRWYPGGPVGKIRFYEAEPTASWLPFKTVFWPYNQVLEIENITEPGEITGPGLRRYDKGINVNELPGTGFIGTREDFAGISVNPH